MGQTANYGLKQWENWEAPSRGTLNETMAAVDGALAGLEADKAELVVGTYTGSGSASRTISLGFQPAAVLVENQSGMRYSGANGFCGGMAAPELSGGLAGEDAALTVTQSGFKVYNGSGDDLRRMNVSGRVYYYMAFRG